ncbi:ribonuclease III [Microcoleus sp.]|uniref:ribonuclease III n=1 Tax=Microcoleus sp. TaxID=44472 RepID=UPI003594337B
MHPRRQQELVKLIARLGLPVNTQVNWCLLDMALTHPTMGIPNYEQLEFIGDSVVRLAASEFLWETYPDKSVGDFSAIRKVLVSDRILAQIADSYGLDRYLVLAASAIGDPSGRISRLADAFEAVLAALYLTTNNLSLIRSWLDPHFQKLATEILEDPARQNYKDALQEWTQGKYKALPEYRVREDTGTSDRSRRFIAEVWFRDKQLGTGTGQSKKAAEQAAAKVAFALLTQ